MKALYILLAGALGVVSISSCNKDDVIDEPTPDAGQYYRPATSTSAATCNRVYEYLPAPGQFINEPLTGGMAQPPTTAADAAEWAARRLDDGLFVSMGAFGGYIVAGFDHSIKATDAGYEIGIAGNAYVAAVRGSNEPGIVYVMQDSNGNGLPDDTWYELKGSEWGTDGTDSSYAVTYYRPDGAGQDIRWVDNRGGSGTVAYVKAFHNQDSYYPAWITADSYTLRGTCLPSRNSVDPATGYWNNAPYGWGYADNIGSDNTSHTDYPQLNRVSISDAIDSTGKPAALSYIDFVKVQTGVNATSGALGEISTEVCAILDLTLTR